MKPDVFIGQKHERLFLSLILLIFTLLAAFFLSGPIFEGPDEIEHYRYIRILAKTGRLPNPYAQPQGELFQPPLYYALATPLALLTNDPDFEQIDGRRNPYHGYQIGIPSNDNKNVYLHTRAESFPYRDSGVARSVHLIRLLSIALGAGTVLTCHAIFRRLWPDHPTRRMLALGFVAFLPQFVYMSSVINNDNLLILLATVSLLLVLKQQQDGPSWPTATLLGATLGLALLTKVSAAFLVFPVGLAVLLDLRRCWRYAALTLTLVLIVAGWWYLRNAILYDDPTGVQALFATWQSEVIQPGQLALDIGLRRAPYAYRGFWARFGHGAVTVGDPLYRFFDFLLVAATAGIILDLVRHRRIGTWRQVAVLGMFGLAWVAVLVYHASQAWSGNQGRYLLPGIAVWGAMLAFGLDQLTPARFKTLVSFGAPGLMALATGISLFGYFLPAYRVAPGPAAVEQPLNYRYSDVAELTGIQPGTVRARPGDIVRITLTWRALRPTESELQPYLHTADSTLVRRDSYPATGNMLSSDWQSGQTWAETYVIVIPEDAEPQRAYPLVAGLYDPRTEEPVPAQDEQGNLVTPIVGQLAITGVPRPTDPDYRFGESIGVTETTVTRSRDAVTVCVTWVALTTTPADYTVFLHVLDENGELLGQVDRQPKGGAYPTSAWVPGESTEDCMTVEVTNLPNEEWQVGLGLYDVTSGERLPIRNSATGELLADGMLLLSQ